MAEKSGRISRFGLALGFAAAAALIGVIHTLSPPERQRVTTYVDSQINRFDGVLNKIAAMRDQVAATPFGKGRKDDTALAERATDFGPRTRSYASRELPVGSANALLLRQAELRRIEVGTEPDDVASDFSFKDHSVFEEIKLAHGSYIEDMARVAYERPYKGWTTESEAREMVHRLDALETVIIYRIGKAVNAVREGDAFTPGYMQADAFVFDLESGDVIGSFSFASTNSNSINAKVIQRDPDWYFRRDMSQNLEIAFWLQVSERMPKAKFQHAQKESPYTAMSLAQAKSRADQRP